MKFKEKVKSFFNVNMDEITKEEEPTKVFEKTSLITLTRNKIFLAIFSFLIIVNLFVGFDLDFLYLRQILGFLFLILVPGLLIMLCFKIRTIKFWEYLVYTIGLSVAFIMFAGLAVNWILPWLGITDQPLSLWPILICFNIFFVILGITVWIRNKDFQFFEWTVPKLDTINNIFFIIPMCFPVLAILGAFVLNNHGSNILTMIMLGGIAVYVLLLTIFRKRLNENIWPWALWMIGLSLLLSGWMRSWLISGVDLNVEYGLFKITVQNSIWSLSNFNNPYNAMLSITILPTILFYFIYLDFTLILKIFFPLIFSLVPLCIFFISKKYFKGIICFFTSFFFISQYFFITWMEIPLRQEIAFLFFSLILLVLFTKEINPTFKKILFLIFGVSMIVSHYSTSYIALALFTLIYIIVFFYKKNEDKKIKKRSLKSEQKTDFYLTGLLVLLLLIVGFLWYNQVTFSSNDLIDFVSKSFSNVKNIFKEEMQTKGQSPLDQFNLFSKKMDYKTELINYNKDTSSLLSKFGGYDFSKYANYNPELKISKVIPYQFNYSLVLFVIYFGEFLKIFIGKILIILGSILLIIKLIKNKKQLLYPIVIFSFLFVLSFISIMPFTSIVYDLTRTYGQILIILSVSGIFGIFFISNLFKKNKFLLPIILIIYFLFFSGFIAQTVGGTNVTLRLNNFGFEYDSLYSHISESLSGDWLVAYNNQEIIQVDDRAKGRIYLSNIKLNLLEEILPKVMNKQNYVYSDYANSKEQIAFKYTKGNLLLFNFPTEFLHDNKNKVYNNGESEIFK